jgi:hypothetical protein
MIGGIGFARMAWRLAKRRTGYEWLHQDILPPKRHVVSRSFRNPYVEYYRIIDSAWSEWKVHPMLRKTVVHL